MAFPYSEYLRQSVALLPKKHESELDISITTLHSKTALFYLGLNLRMQTMKSPLTVKGSGFKGTHFTMIFFMKVIYSFFCLYLLVALVYSYPPLG